MHLKKFLIEKGALASMSEANRYIACGIVKVNGEEVDNLSAEVKVGDVVQVGKKKTFIVSEDIENDISISESGKCG